MLHAFGPSSPNPKNPTTTKTNGTAKADCRAFFRHRIDRQQRDHVGSNQKRKKNKHHHKASTRRRRSKNHVLLIVQQKEEGDDDQERQRQQPPPAQQQQEEEGPHNNIIILDDIHYSLASHEMVPDHHFWNFVVGMEHVLAARSRCPLGEAEENES